MTANGQRASFGTAATHSAHNGVVVELERGMDYVYGRNGTLYAEIARIRRFARFRKFLEESGLVAPLVDSQYTYTVLVPSDK